MIDYKIDPFPAESALARLWQAGWGGGRFRANLHQSLAHLGAISGVDLIGFVNVAGDGGAHAFITDTTVHPDFRRQGIGAQLVTRAAAIARVRGAEWLHVDYEVHLAGFYQSCGFAPTAAGLIRLCD